MDSGLEVILVKKLKNRRIDCTCGMAVMPTDPSPDLSENIKTAAREFGAKFTLLDALVHPDAMQKYSITALPAVVIDNRTYPADAGIVKEILAGLIK